MFSENLENISIGDLARQSGFAPSAIRYHESLGLLTSKRTEGGQRRYPPEAVLKLRQLKFAQSAGFTLAEISDLLGPTDLFAPAEPGDYLFSQWRERAEKKLIELDAVIAQAEEMKSRLRAALACNCQQPEDCTLLS